VWLWRLRLLFLVILGCTLANSAPVGAAEAPSKGGTIVWAVHESMPDFDIHYSDTYIVAQPIGSLYNGLLTFDMYDNEKIVGDLAERWEITEDGKRITFALHKGVKFHDGTNFTCADAIYSLEKLTDPKRAGTLFVTLWKISSPVPAVLTILPWCCPSRSPRLWC
jgi:peptide/nickel transport system substrate-binding protein